MKKKPAKKAPRNPAALPAKARKASPMKHKLTPKGGAKNKRAEIIEDEL